MTRTRRFSVAVAVVSLASILSGTKQSAAQQVTDVPTVALTPEGKKYLAEELYQLVARFRASGLRSTELQQLGFSKETDAIERAIPMSGMTIVVGNIGLAFDLKVGSALRARDPVLELALAPKTGVSTLTAARVKNFDANIAALNRKLAEQRLAIRDEYHKTGRLDQAVLGRARMFWFGTPPALPLALQSTPTEKQRRDAFITFVNASANVAAKQ